MNCIETGRLLNAYADGELDLQSVVAIETHLQSCARCRASAAGLRTLHAAINRACEPDSAPARLRNAVRADLATAAAAPASRAAWLAAAPGIAAMLMIGWMLVAQPRQQPGLALPDANRVVYHIASSENVDASLRTLKNHLDAAPGLHIVVVAHNNGIEFLLEGAKDGTGRPYVAALQDFRERGVEFRVCTNTLTRRQIDTRKVVREAVLVPSGIAEISRLQGREGYTYLRL